MNSKAFNHVNNDFSVVIPLYNKEKYIQRAINSILNQTHQKFEIIIINDGSTDDSERLAESMRDKRIKIYNQSNQGVSSARNMGVSFSKYNLITFLDADDIWENTFLKEINKLVNKFPEAALFGTNNYFQYPNGLIKHEKYETLFFGKNVGIIDDYFDIFLKTGKSPFSNSNYCIRKNIFEKEGGYKPGIKLTEDSTFWCKVALKHKIAYSTTPSATYFLGLEGSSHYIFEPKELEITKFLQGALRTNQVKQKFKKSVIKLIALHKLNLIKRSILTGNKFFALGRVFNFKLFRSFPLEVSKCALSLLIPSSILLKWSRKNYFK